MFQHSAEEQFADFIKMRLQWRSWQLVILKICSRSVYHLLKYIVFQQKLTPIQCSIPVFEDLLPEPHNGIILNLLFVLCTWHAYAKLRLHTTSTLNALKEMTKALGQLLQLWVKRTCSCFTTCELPKEESARHCRKAAAAGKSSGTARGRSSGACGGRGTTWGSKATNTTQRTTCALETPARHNSKLRRVFNMCTYKIHALGHYVAAIARFGTTDGYSTQIVCIHHFFWYYINSITRVNSNIGGSNGSTHELISAQHLLNRLPSSNNNNESCDGLGNSWTKKRIKPNLLQFPPNLNTYVHQHLRYHLRSPILCQRRLLNFVITYQIPHAWKTTFFTG